MYSHWNEENPFNQQPNFYYPLNLEYVNKAQKYAPIPFDSYSIACQETCGMAIENKDPKRRVKRHASVREKHFNWVYEIIQEIDTIFVYK